MKHLSCSALVPSCTAEFRGATDSKVLAQYAQHASLVHVFRPLPVSTVRAAISHPAGVTA